MTHRPTTLERAYQLADSGDFKTVGDIKRRLTEERYERVKEHLEGPSIMRALRERCARTWRPPEVEA